MSVDIINKISGYFFNPVCSFFESRTFRAESADNPPVMPEKINNVIANIKAIGNLTIPIPSSGSKKNNGWSKTFFSLLTVSSFIQRTGAQDILYNRSHSWITERDANITQSSYPHQAFMLRTIDRENLIPADNVAVGVYEIENSDNHPYNYYFQQKVHAKTTTCVTKSKGSDTSDSPMPNKTPAAVDWFNQFELNLAESDNVLFSRCLNSTFFFTSAHHRQYDDVSLYRDKHRLNNKIIRFCSDNQLLCARNAVADFQFASPEGVVPDEQVFMALATDFMDNALVHMLLGKTLMDYITDQIRNHPYKKKFYLFDLMGSPQLPKILNDAANFSLSAYPPVQREFMQKVITRAINALFPFLQSERLKNSTSMQLIPLDSEAFTHLHIGSLFMQATDYLSLYSLEYLQHIGKRISSLENSDPDSYRFWSYRYIAAAFSYRLKNSPSSSNSFYSDQIIAALKNASSYTIIRSSKRSELKSDHLLINKLFSAPSLYPTLVEIMLDTLEYQGIRHCYDHFLTLNINGEEKFLPLKQVGWQHDKPVFVFIEPDTKEIIWHFILIGDKFEISLPSYA